MVQTSSTFVTTVLALKDSFPLLEYNTMELSCSFTDRTSTFPSPSTSFAVTAQGPLASLVTNCLKNIPLPSFLYHEIVLSYLDADRTSILPSPFRSTGNTDTDPFIFLEMAWET